MKLEIEITEEMQGKLQDRANRYAIEPSDVAKMILAVELAVREKPCWMDKLSNMVTRITEALVAVSKEGESKTE